MSFGYKTIVISPVKIVLTQTAVTMNKCEFRPFLVVDPPYIEAMIHHSSNLNA
jgi:hypothetical protein